MFQHRLIPEKLIAALVLFLCFGLVAPASVTQAQTATPSPMQPLEFRTDPVLQIASYYNAINLGDYARAYSYWENPPEGATLAQFSAGFANTERAAVFARLPVMVDAGAGNLFAQVPVLIASDQTDGTQQFFAGCITAHRVNVPEGNATEPDPNWRLNTADIVEVDEFDFALLDESCDPNLITLVEDFPENLNSPVNLLSSYFAAIANRDYTRAFGYWETPPETTPTLNTFQQGFANTQDVSSVILRLDISAEGAAGSTYASLPALVIATQINGSVQYFGGCYVARHVNVPQGNNSQSDPDWRFYSSDVNPIASLNAGPDLLEGAC